MKCLCSFLTFFFIISWIIPAYSKEPHKNEKVPEVKFTTPGSYTARKIILFPIEIPGYVMHALIFPVDAAMQMLERERVFERAADFLSNKDKTFFVYPIIEYNLSSNFGGGLGIKHIDLFHDQYELDASYRIHVNLDQFADASFGKKDAFFFLGKPVSFNLTAKYKRLLGNDYYGIGNDSTRNDHSTFTLDDIDTKANISYEFMKNLSAEAFIGIIGDSTGPKGRGGYPNVDTTFPPAQTAGYNRWISYFRAGAGLIHDTRDSENRPRSGGVRELRFERYQFLGSGSYDYNEYTLDVGQYFTPWKGNFTIYLHNKWVFQQETGKSRIPFYRLAALDMWSLLRGFKRGRFRDTSSVLFNIEGHYPISRLIDCMVFYDTGRVFDGISNISFNNIKYSAGFGLKLHFTKINILRFMLGYGGEGVNWSIGVSKQI
jgi:hypothetical protein